MIRAAAPFTAPQGSAKAGPVAVTLGPRLGSSQFVGALLMVAARLPGGLDLRTDRPAAPLPAAHRDDRGHAPRATSGSTTRARPLGGCARADRAAGRTVEPDLSNAAAFLAAAAITGGAVTVPHWPGSTEQPGDAIHDILTRFGAEAELRRGPDRTPGTDHLHGIDLDLSAASELTPVVAAVAALADDLHICTASATSRARDRPAGRAGRRAGTARRPRLDNDGLTIHPDCWVERSGGPTPTTGCQAGRRSARPGSARGHRRRHRLHGQDDAGVRRPVAGHKCLAPRWTPFS